MVEFTQFMSNALVNAKNAGGAIEITNCKGIPEQLIYDVSKFYYYEDPETPVKLRSAPDIYNRIVHLPGIMHQIYQNDVWIPAKDSTEVMSYSKPLSTKWANGKFIPPPPPGWSPPPAAPSSPAATSSSSPLAERRLRQIIRLAIHNQISSK
jgi:hypothetical protein